MTEFKASAVAFEVQKSFANKFFSNKTVAKTLIDETSSHLLDNLYLLLYVFVSILNLHIVASVFTKDTIVDPLKSFRRRTRRNRRRQRGTL